MARRRTRAFEGAGERGAGGLPGDEGLQRSFFALAPSGVVLNDADGRILAFNDQAFQQLGYTREEFARLRLSDVDAREQPGDVRRHIARIAAAGFEEYEVEHRTKSGSVRSVLVRTRPLDVDGERRFLNVWHDITDRKRAEQGLRDSEERLRAFAESIPHVAFMTDAEGKVSFVNGRFAEYFGVPLEALGATGWRSLVHPEDVERTLREWEAGVRAGVAFTIEHRLRRRDGALRWHATRLAPARDGEPSTWAGTSTDVHDQREATAELARVNAELREVDRRKTEFLGQLSHELRNPLAPIRTGLHLLDRAAPGSEEAERAREAIRRQTEHLTRLVDDLLDVTRISRGKIDLRRARVELGRLAHRTAEDLRPLLDASGVALRVEAPGEPVWIDADPVRIAQVLGNLLQNAAKFTPRGGHVDVRVAAAGGQAELRVSDDGIGMSPGEVERMFEPFAQGDRGIPRTAGGLGLGLALVKGLVELHGGSAWARSDGPGRGAEFVVSLPRSEPEAPSVQAGAAPGPVRRRRVLVVEDNGDFAAVLEDLLRFEGHDVRVAADGRTGIALARELRPDVVLCDIGLPDVDGYEIARTLRGDRALAATRLVAVSGYAAPEDRRRAREAGFDHHLAKPPSPEDVLRAVDGT